MTLGKTIHATDNQALRQTWRTEPELFNTLHSIFRFTIDACASPDNALLPTYWTAEQDCRKQDWKVHRVFCNPPFKDIGSILAKAPEAELAVFLLPLTALTTRYYHKYQPDYLVIPPYRLTFIPPVGSEFKTRSPSLGRLTFIPPVRSEFKTGSPSSLGTVLLIYAMSAMIDDKLSELKKQTGFEVYCLKNF